MIRNLLHPQAIIVNLSWPQQSLMFSCASGGETICESVWGRYTRKILSRYYANNLCQPENNFCQKQRPLHYSLWKTKNCCKSSKEIFAHFGKQVLTTASIPKENFCSIVGKTREKRQDLEQKATTNIQTLCPVNHTSWINIGTKEVIRKAPCEVLFTSTEQDKYAEERLAVAKAFPSFIAEPYNKTFDKILQKTKAQIHNSPSWKIPWTEEPGRLQSMGSLRVRYDWATSLSRIGQGNGNPLQCSCLENPRDGGVWWAAVYGVTQSQTQLKWLSSSSSANQTQIRFPEKKKQQVPQDLDFLKKILENTPEKTTPIDVEMKLQHKCTIGPNCNSVQEILKRTGVSTEISPSYSMSDSVAYHYKPESLRKEFTEDYLKTKIYTLSSISAPSWLHRFVIGTKRS